MESPTLLQILVIALLLGYGGGITTAFVFMAGHGRGYGGAPVVVEQQADPLAGCGWGCLGLLGLAGLVGAALVSVLSAGAAGP